MIIKGQSISGWRKHCRHLLKHKSAGIRDGNEQVELVCSHNLYAGNELHSALEEMAAVAQGSRCERWLYSVAISPAEAGGRQLNDAEAEYAGQQLLKALGFSEDHSWIMVRHVKEGRAHFHLCASRIDPLSLRAVHLGWNYVKHEQVARVLEEHFQLRPTQGAFTRRRKKVDGKFADRRPIAIQSTADAQQSLRTGIPINQAINEINIAWQHALNGEEFALLLEGYGYVLARGQRREMVIVDCMGGVHSPTRRLGIRAASFRQKTNDLDPSALPTVDSVREQLRLSDCVEDDHQNRPEREETPDISRRTP